MAVKDIQTKTEAKQLSELSVDGNLFDLECYENVEAIKLLKDEWQKLENTCTEDFTVFQSYNWCIEYYKQFADDLTDKHCPIPQVFVLRADNKPIMIWPMMRIQSRTSLKILTTATEPLGQYSNLLFDRSFEKKIGQAVLKLMIENSKADLVSLNNFPKACLIDHIIADQGITENSKLESSILNLSQYNNWESYTQTLSKGQRKERRRNLNKLQAQGTISYKVHLAGSKEFPALVEQALEMKTTWLLETGRKPGILADQSTKAMFMNLQMSKPAKNEEIQGPVVHALSLDGKVIAIELGMIKDDRYYSYLGAIDWSMKDFSPGKIQIAMAQEWCMSKGIKNFDLLHDPSDYKTSWTNHTHQVISKNIPITAKGYIYSQLWKTHLRPKLKSIYHFAGTKNRDRLNKIADIFRK